jgi:hypothetical protein
MGRTAPQRKITERVTMPRVGSMRTLPNSIRKWPSSILTRRTLRASSKNN